MSMPQTSPYLLCASPCLQSSTQYLLPRLTYTPATHAILVPCLVYDIMSILLPAGPKFYKFFGLSSSLLSSLLGLELYRLSFLSLVLKLDLVLFVLSVNAVICPLPGRVIY